MAAKKTKKKSNKTSDHKLGMNLDLEPEQAELVSQIPWFNERYLLPGERVNDYDLRLQLLIDSIKIRDALDAILAKDIHDELREVQRMRTLRQSILLKGMRSSLTTLLSGGIYSFDEDPRVTHAFEIWDKYPESGNDAILELLEGVGATMGSLMADVFAIESDKLQLLELQLSRHEKNVRETLKMIDLRRNHDVMRQRIESDLEYEQSRRIDI